MYNEQLHHARSNHGSTVRVEAHILTVEEADKLGFELKPGLDGLQVVALGYDQDDKLTGMVPIVLTNQEEDASKTDRTSFEEMLKRAAETAKNEFGLQP